MKVIALYSIKGGVGKTASAVNLAHVAASENKRTLIVDLDPQGSTTYYLRVKPPKKFSAESLVAGRLRKVSRQIRESDFSMLDLLPASLSFRNLDLALGDAKRSKRRLALVLAKLKNHYDYVFLDCPPNLTLLAENIFRAADLVVAPVVPTPLSFRTHQQLIGFFKDQDLDRSKLRPFFSMVQAQKKLHCEYIERFRELEKRLLRSAIPNATDVEKMGIKREPLTATKPNSKLGKIYRELWSEIKDRA